MNVDQIIKQAATDPQKFDQKVKKALLKKKRTLVEVANQLNVPPKLVEQSVERLVEAGHNVRLEGESVEIHTDVQEGNKLVVDPKSYWNGQWYTFGVVADSHLYSRYARLDVLRSLYRIFEREGVKHVYHGGNAIDGECRFNKHDLVGPSGMQHQLEYFAQEYPEVPNITTHFITGDDHEGWYNQREGVNIGLLMQDAARNAGREDLEYIGHIEADVRFKQPGGSDWMKIMHPGGGSSYALSYTTQKIAEAFQGGEKPRILICGHYHKYDVGYPREIWTLQPGCTQDQTPFMRKLKLQAFVGGAIVRFHQAKTGEINRFQHEWLPYFDTGFYEKKERFRRW